VDEYELLRQHQLQGCRHDDRRGDRHAALVGCRSEPGRQYAIRGVAPRCGRKWAWDARRDWIRLASAGGHRHSLARSSSAVIPPVLTSTSPMSQDPALAGITIRCRRGYRCRGAREGAEEGDGDRFCGRPCNYRIRLSPHHGTDRNEQGAAPKATARAPTTTKRRDVTPDHPRPLSALRYMQTPW
jgi:hypothetical protein